MVSSRGHGGGPVWLQGRFQLLDSMLKISDKTIRAASPTEEKQLALRYLLDAWEEAVYEGVDPDCLATAAIFAALSELITHMSGHAGLDPAGAKANEQQAREQPRGGIPITAHTGKRGVTAKVNLGDR